MRNAATLYGLLLLTLSGGLSEGTRAEPLTPPMESPSLRTGINKRAAEQLGPLDALARYELDLTLEDSPARFSFRERAHITHAHRSGPLDELIFVVYANTAGAKRGDGSPAITLTRGSCPTRAKGCAASSDATGFVRVRLNEPLAVGEAVDVLLEFEGVVPVLADDRTGFGAQMMESLSSLVGHAKPSDFGLLATGNGIVSMGGFMAVLAPRQAAILGALAA